ncbi:GNAT family N-acetyltransferase [Acaryochloris sp. IP29b_bin.137]|uniref:GNAT family N-acetyltransferase n=1 Tax=Acaryochloris sp. IP29b_bin.137 TaxID=2969217 RepID=UPI002615AE3E|nr:GNAT family N-acetyltransferase [Acaryochloris sp. IP29b_bin.137]
MVNQSSNLPFGCVIRPIKTTNIDRLRLMMMPKSPDQLPSWVSVKMMLALYKMRTGTILYLITAVVIGMYLQLLDALGIPIQVPWVVIVYLVCLGLFIALGIRSLAKPEQLPKNCWVIEERGRFVGRALIKGYGSYSILGRVYIHPMRRRMGLGTELVKSLLQNYQKPTYVLTKRSIANFYIGIGFRKLSQRDKQRLHVSDSRYAVRSRMILLVHNYFFV